MKKKASIAVLCAYLSFQGLNVFALSSYNWKRDLNQYMKETNKNLNDVIIKKGVDDEKVLDNKDVYLTIEGEGKKIYNVSKYIKIQSAVEKRLIRGRIDYHRGLDLTLIKERDILQNCKYKGKYNKWLSKGLDPFKYCGNPSEGHLDKNKYNIYINIDNKSGSKFYYVANRSRYKWRKGLYGFGGALIQNIGDKNYYIYAHTDYNYLKKKYGNCLKRVDNKEINKILFAFYEGNYYSFFMNKDKSIDYELIDHFEYRPTNEVYEITCNKLKIKYGNTGNSFGKHIHFGMLFRDGDYVRLVSDNETLLKGLNLIVKNNLYNILEKDNVIKSLIVKYLKQKNYYIAKTLLFYLMKISEFSLIKNYYNYITTKPRVKQ